MPSIPLTAELQFSGFSLQDSSVIERSDVERGPAKTRRTASDPIVTANGTLFFRTREATATFRAWFYSAAGANAGAGWIDWMDPRTGTARKIRFVTMGPLTPLAGRFAIAQQSVVFEYVDTIEEIAVGVP